MENRVILKLILTLLICGNAHALQAALPSCGPSVTVQSWHSSLSSHKKQFCWFAAGVAAIATAYYWFKKLTVHKKTKGFASQFQGLLDQDATEDITENFMTPELTAPAPSFVPLRKITASLREIALADIKLIGIKDDGDLFCRHVQTDHDIIVLNSHEADKKRAEYEVIHLPDNWSIVERYLKSGTGAAQWKNFSYIPLIRPIAPSHEEIEDAEGIARPTRELGAFDINTRVISSIGHIYEDDQIFAINAHSSVIKRLTGENPAAFYLISGNERVFLSMGFVDMVSSRYFPHSLDTQHSRVCFHSFEDDRLHVKDLSGTELVLPAEAHKTEVGIMGTNMRHCLQTRGSTIIVTIEHADQPLSMERSIVQQWHYDRTLNSWKLASQHPFGLYGGTLDTNIDNTIITGADMVKAYSSDHAANDCLKIYGLILKSGKSAEMLSDDFTAYNQGNFPKVAMTSNNARYIATQLRNQKIYVWKLRGINLPGSVSFADRCILHELDEMYRIGQERNKKYNKNYVIRLNPQQWVKFQKLSQRPECEVPQDWARLFRPLK